MMTMTPTRAKGTKATTRRGVRATGKGATSSVSVASSKVATRTKASPARVETTTSSSSAYAPAGTVKTGVYPVAPTASKTYQNVDGMRYNDGRYTKFQEDIKSIVPE